MEPGILFWFYKNEALCKNRLQLLRRKNPDTPIYGLYGGRPESAERFRAALTPLLDDFYVYPSPQDATWKWLNGDLMIAAWYRDRGHRLHWKTLVLVQWDMLVFGRVAALFAELNEDEVLLSSLRPVSEVADWWHWVSGENKPWYARFVQHLQEACAFDGEPLCCQFVIVAFPRVFLEHYSAIEAPELGFIEYRVPTYARVFGIPVRSIERFDCWWEGDPANPPAKEIDKVLSAGRNSIALRTVVRQYYRTGGACIIHPFHKIFPVDLPSAFRFIRESLRQVLQALKKRLQAKEVTP